MPTELQLSVVIPTWNRRNEMALTLEALKSLEAPAFEIIIVDNASTDGTAEMVLAEHPDVRLIRMPTNLGPTGARNAGVAAARAEVIVLLDSDTEPLPGALEAIWQRLRGDPALGVVNALQIDGSTGKPWWWWGPHGYPEDEYVDREFDSAFKVEEGACGIRKSAFQEAGGFEQRLYFCGEGRDLAARVVHAGYAIRYCPEVRFLHRPGSNRPSTNAVYTSSGRFYYEFRNELWYTWRYFPFGWAVVKTAHNLVVNLRRALRYRVVGAYARATFDGVVGLGWVLRNRLPLDKEGLSQVVSRHNRRWLGSQDIEALPG